VVVGGAVISAVAILTTFVGLPVFQRWSDREAMIAVRTDQLARTEAVLAGRASLSETLDALREEQARMEPRLLQGATVAVAASNLQLLLNGYVTEAGMELQRVDALGEAEDLGSLQRVPARLTVRGDVRGFVYLLARLHESEPFLAIDELRLSTTVPRPGDPELLTAIISLHGYAGAREVTP
jgi:hypothetical protein